MGRQISSVHLPDVTEIAPDRCANENCFDTLLPDSLCRHHRPNLLDGGSVAAKRDGFCLYPTAYPVGQKTASKKERLIPESKDPGRPIVAGWFDRELEHHRHQEYLNSGTVKPRGEILHNENADQSDQKNCNTDDRDDNADALTLGQSTWFLFMLHDVLALCGDTWGT